MKETLLSSMKVTAIVGTILNVINQYQPLVTLDFSKISLGKLVLTYFVPFLVSIYSSNKTQQKMRKSK